MNAANPNSLSGLLDNLKSKVNGDPVDVGELVKAFQYRGFGPLLLVPALLVILVGAIPGIPAVGGLVIALISIQIILGREHPWLPKKLRSFSVSGKKLRSGIRIVKPYAEKIDSFIRPRFKILITKFSKRCVAVVTFVLACLTVIIGFIPGLPILAMLPVLFFALGFSARDGLLIGLGLGFVVLGVTLAPLFLQGV